MCPIACLALSSPQQVPAGHEVGALALSVRVPCS